MSALSHLLRVWKWISSDRSIFLLLQRVSYRNFEIYLVKSFNYLHLFPSLIAFSEKKGIKLSTTREHVSEMLTVINKFIWSKCEVKGKWSQGQVKPVSSHYWYRYYWCRLYGTTTSNSHKHKYTEQAISPLILFFILLNYLLLRGLLDGTQFDTCSLFLLFFLFFKKKGEISIESALFHRNLRWSILERRRKLKLT